MTKSYKTSVIALVLASFAPPLWAASIKAQPGLWKVTVTARRNGQSNLPHTSEHCLTQKEIDTFSDKFANAQKISPEENCQRASFNETATTVDWKYTCTGKFNMTSEGSVKFDKPTHYVGTVSMNGNLMGHDISNSTTMEGTRIGECTGKEAGSH